jgi:protein deglycase
MTNVLVTLAPGFEEIETITVVDILRRAGARLTLAAIVPGVIDGSRGIKIVPDEKLETVIDKKFDLIFLPGGQPGTDNLKNELRVDKLLQKMQDQGKYICAICTAPIILQKAGILKDRSMTCHPSIKSQFDTYTDNRVVIDGKIITSQSSGRTMELALKLVEILFGVDRMKKVNAGVLARI